MSGFIPDQPGIPASFQWEIPGLESRQWELGLSSTQGAGKLSHEACRALSPIVMFDDSLHAKYIVCRAVSS